MPSSHCVAVSLVEGLRTSGSAGQDSSNLFDLHPKYMNKNSLRVSASIEH